MIELENDDLFDCGQDENSDREDDQYNASGNENQSGDENEQTKKDEKKTVKKRIITNPRPKLDAQRLCGERGIAELPKIFDKVHFKGKGHEKEDLHKMMKLMEHWGHRLFPKLTFDDILEKIEKLGARKNVQTCLKKIRMDMPLGSGITGASDNEDDNVNRGAGPVETEMSSRSGEDAFDAILREYKSKQPDHDTSVSNMSSAYSLSLEQRQAIAIKRLEAEERRRSRLAALKDSSSMISSQSVCEEVPTGIDGSLLNATLEVDELHSDLHSHDSNIHTDDLEAMFTDDLDFSENNEDMVDNQNFVAT